jgi:hypothetical protein
MDLDQNFTEVSEGFFNVLDVESTLGETEV